MTSKNEFITYLLSTPFNFTSQTDRKPSVSHDEVSDFLRQERSRPSQVWSAGRPKIEDSKSSVIIGNNSVQGKRHSTIIELVKREYSGSEYSMARAWSTLSIPLVVIGGFLPIDYRVFDPQNDGTSKNDGTAPPALLGNVQAFSDSQKPESKGDFFDSWYGSVDKLKLINRAGWTLFTTFQRPLKSNRLVSVSK